MLQGGTQSLKAVETVFDSCHGAEMDGGNPQGEVLRYVRVGRDSPLGIRRIRSTVVKFERA